MLWPAAERAELLRGLSALAASEERTAALASEWASLAPLLAAQPQLYPPAQWSEPAFAASLAVVLSCAVLLPAADCFALLPLASLCRRRGVSPAGARGAASPVCAVDYDAGRSAVLLLATQPLPEGSAVILEDAQGRNSTELLLSGGEGADAGLGERFDGDYLLWSAALLPGDRLFEPKRAALEAAGLDAAGTTFPVYSEGMPQQLLAFLRLSRITDALELARVRFDSDAPVSQLNEYEVLQLMLADARDRMAAPPGSLDEDVKQVQDAALGERARAAAALRLAERRLLVETSGWLRRRLAPIRGVPTKGGKMQRANSDILEIFETLENFNSKPREIINEMLGWDEDGKLKGPKPGGCG